MTTIAYDGKTLVSDSQSTIGDQIYEVDCQKLFPDVGPFAVLGVCGDYQAAMDVLKVIRDFNRIDHIRDLDFKELNWKCAMLGITHDGQVWHYTDTFSFELRPDISFAIGSGSDYALGAMAAGATAEEAVKIAARYDVNTNDVTQVATLVSEEKPKKKKKDK